MGFDAIELRFAHLIGSARARTGSLRINADVEIIIDFRIYYGRSHYLHLELYHLLIVDQNTH